MLNVTNWTARLNELATEARVPGAALGIWADGQEILVAAGELNSATRVPVTADSLFQVGSITKIWTATMIMQLADEGQLSLDTTVAEVLPGARLGTADVGGQVTVRHLLTHTSGIDGDVFTDTGRGDECVERYIGLLAETPSVFAPGAAYSYCNSGFVVLGRIIEVLDGQSWDESLRERLVSPLALTQTVTLPEEAILHRAAVGHRRGGTPVDVWNLPRSVGPAGLISATAGDLLTFARLHLDGGVTADGKRVVSEASVAAMQTAGAAIPEFSAPGSAIGLGWRLSRWGDRTIIGHDGDTIGQSAYLRIDPEARAAACLLTNATESETLYRQVFNEVFGTLTGVTMPAPPRPGATGPRAGRALDPGQHAGRYERVSRRFDVSVRDGQLRMVTTMTGNLATLTVSEPEELLLYPADSSGTRFVLRSRDDEPWAPLSFGRLSDGTPCICQGGRVTPRTG
ncbi:MAG TPA: serine hydrolase domain-containing protein [Streptosporangiaceae bacterium]|nr:serine hydrolase domain-containing protein [Streptosporangiaceae bacterium]